MTRVENLYGLILAGGFSRRMGQDKALLTYHDGKPQIEYVEGLLGQYCSKVFLSKRSDQKKYTVIPVKTGIQNHGSPIKTFGDDSLIINDSPEFVGIGPLGGILSAMKSYPEVSWLIMACDLPFVTTETLTTLIQNRDNTKVATAFKSSSDNLPEPLCAIWEGHSYPKILEFLKTSKTCPRKFLINSDTKILKQQNPHWLDNVNDPNEFDHVASILKSNCGPQ